jgi:hypothetical protein
VCALRQGSVNVAATPRVWISHAKRAISAPLSLRAKSQMSIAPFGLALALLAASSAVADGPLNPAIDAQGYVRAAREAMLHRDARRLSEDEFLLLRRVPHAVVLDARSKEKYDELHIVGAVNLSFPDMAIDSLERTLPDKDALILIYCNNNFANAPGPFPSKLANASLNLSTYVALYEYGYRNVYELGPLIDIRATRIPFESSPPALDKR